VLGVELGLEAALGGELKRWAWRRPRLLKDWQVGGLGKELTCLHGAAVIVQLVVRRSTGILSLRS